MSDESERPDSPEMRFLIEVAQRARWDRTIIGCVRVVVNAVGS
jgi:hypothetical protein